MTKYPSWYQVSEEQREAVMADLPSALQVILRDHLAWLNDRSTGKRAILSRLDLSGLDLSFQDLRRADLSYSDLRGMDFTCADLRGTDLTGALLNRTILRNADMSEARWSESPTSFLARFERTSKGIIAYKSFNAEFDAPAHWVLQPKSVLTEVVNPDRGTRSSGINVASWEWVQKYSGPFGIWKCLVRWEWLAGVVVPFGSDGEFRTERLELLKELYPKQFGETAWQVQRRIDEKLQESAAKHPKAPTGP